MGLHGSHGSSWVSWVSWVFMGLMGLMGLMPHADTPFRRYAITLAHLNLRSVLFVLWG
jgi:hypothetical protein